MLYLVNRNVPTDLHVWAKLNIIAMTSAYYVLFNFWIMLQISVLETSGLGSLLDQRNSKCCNGILGYPWHRTFMPCSEMRCCNSSETVALEKVNHAVGFCLRCLPKIQFLSHCHKLGEEVATSNTSSVSYETRTCCDGLKFKIIPNSENTAMVIICVHR